MSRGPRWDRIRKKKDFENLVTHSLKMALLHIDPCCIIPNVLHTVLGQQRYVALLKRNLLYDIISTVKKKGKN